MINKDTTFYIFEYEMKNYLDLMFGIYEDEVLILNEIQIPIHYFRFFVYSIFHFQYQLCMTKIIVIKYNIF